MISPTIIKGEAECLDPHDRGQYKAWYRKRCESLSHALY